VPAAAVAELLTTRRAEEELRQIWRYIAAENPAAADRLLLRIDDKLQLLLPPVIPEAEPQARLSGTFSGESYVRSPRSRIGSLLACGSPGLDPGSVRDDGWKGALDGMSTLF